MSDWKFLNQHRVRNPVPPRINPVYASDDSFGFNGMFRIPIAGEIVRCVASDGSDSEEPMFKWEHVSVSIEHNPHPPRWGLMCKIKDLFWNEEDWVVQFHPARSAYVNYAKNCLHLWRPLVEKLPTPASIMVGPLSRF